MEWYGVVVLVDELAVALVELSGDADPDEETDEEVIGDSRPPLFATVLESFGDEGLLRWCCCDFE